MPGARAASALADRTLTIAGADILLRCGGDRAAGVPMVVLEAGAGNGADTWAKVQPDIAAFARVCAYDRPTLVRGAGSGRPPTPTPQAVVNTLDGVLAAGGERAPYVLVGHSYGGMIVRLFAGRFPERVVGMVLIDSSHEDQQRRFAAADPSRASTPPAATAHEAFDLDATSRALSADRWHAPIPLVVLTRTPPAAGSTPAPGPAPADYEIWLDLQRELAGRSPRGEHIVAVHSGHYIHNDEPQLVIDAVRRVVAAATAQ